MCEFHSNSKDFFRRTRRRVVAELSVLALLEGFFLSVWSSSWPDWLEVSILVLFVAYIVFGLAYYPKAKSIAQMFSIRLMDEALGFPSEGVIKQIPYRDITISKVVYKNGEVVSIHLKTSFGQSIKLQGMEDMKGLYEGIAAHISRSR